MKIKIKKLFGKYDTEVDLNKRCTVFIGDNGIGKSTTLNIIDCVLRKDFYNLLKYKFEALVLNEQEIYDYFELVPTKEELINNLVNDKDDFFYHEKIKKIIENLNYDIYFELIPSIINNKYTTREKRIIYRIMHGWSPSTNEYFDKFVKIIRETIKKMINKKRMHIFYEKKYSQLIEFNQLKCYKLDMTKNKKIINSNKFMLSNRYDQKKDSKSNVEGKFQIKLNNYNGYNMTFDNDVKISKSQFYSPMTGLDIEDYGRLDKIKEYQEKYNNISEEVYIRDTMNSFNQIKKTSYIEKKINNSTLDISKLLLSLYYEPKYIESIIREYFNYVKNHSLNYIEDYDWQEKLYDLNRTYEIENYILPLLPKNSLFEIENNDCPSYDFKLLYEFYEKVKNKIEKYSSNRKIEKLQMLLNKYFEGKEVDVTPSKITISERKKYKNNKNQFEDIDYEFLSQGEKKIIIIFIVTVIFDDVVLLLDEPEISLSIVWQETLLLDILKETKVKNIVAATQSPYMINDDRLDETIKPILGLDEDYE